MTEPSSYFHIANGSVYFLADETMCTEAVIGHTNYLKVTIHGFKIANLDQERNMIQGKIIAFEGSECTSEARELGYALMDVYRGNRQPTTVCNNIELEPITESSISIKRDDNVVTVLNTEIPDLASWVR